MFPSVLGRAPFWILSWGLAVAALILALERPAPLLLNLGAGDAPFARGFRGSWERDGLQQSGETMFRWTQDGSRLEFPVSILSGTPTLRMRVARFTEPPVAITLRAAGRDVAHWTQERSGWRIRNVELGDLRGALGLQFRSPEDAEGLGVALDWVEVAGAGWILPSGAVLLGLATLLLGVPLALGLQLRRVLPGFVAGALLTLLAAAALLLDRFGGLMALATAGPPALVASIALTLLAQALARAWSETETRDRLPLALPLGAALVALVALAHPFYYYPDVDTHARFLAAIRADPYLAWDPSAFQLRAGTWTREIAGTRVAFPYSPVFHLAAWPLAFLFGEALAIKTAVVVALGTTLLLVYALARALGLGATEGIVSQVVLALLPVTASRLALALYPTLLGQAMDLLLLVHLVRRFPRMDGARAAGAAFLFLLLAQAAYVGSLPNVFGIVALFAGWELVRGDRCRALRLLAAYALAAAVVVAVMYARFLPVLVRDVLPNAAAAPANAAEADVLGVAWDRLTLFYDAVYPLLAVLGFLSIASAPPHARRLVAAVLATGLGLLFLRGALPSLLRDAKEVELLAPSVAVLAAAALARLWRGALPARVAAGLATAYALQFGALRAAHVYAERFLAKGF